MVDEQLLAQRSDALRQDSDTNHSSADKENVYNAEVNRSRQEYLAEQEKKEELEILEGQEKKKSGPRKINAVRRATSSLLRMSWQNLISSFGLTLSYINIHSFLNLVFGPSYFCDLGDEWTDMSTKSFK